jgi:hypothetical protein
VSIQFKKAERRAVKLKIGVDGPSGSGKTLGALALAHGITKGGRIAVADSENGSAALYSDRYEFDTVVIPSADPKTYIEIIDAAVDAGYDAIVIDSLTHAWQAVLNAKDDHDRDNPKSNQWTNWRIFAPRWEALMQHILQAPIHVIATMRSKQAYEQIDKGGGKKAVVKLGLQPQVRDGSEYEFGIVFSVNQAHRAEATKDRTALFTDQMIDLTDPEVHASLVGWMNSGGPIVSAIPDRASLDQLGRLNSLMLHETVTEEVKAKINRKISRGLTSGQANTFITQLEAKIAETSDDSRVARAVEAVTAETAELPF